MMFRAGFFKAKFWAARFFGGVTADVEPPVEEETPFPSAASGAGSAPWTPVRFTRRAPIFTWRRRPLPARVRATTEGKLSWSIPFAALPASNATSTLPAREAFTTPLHAEALARPVAVAVLTGWANDATYWETKYREYGQERRLHAVRVGHLRDRIDSLESELADMEDLVALQLTGGL